MSLFKNRGVNQTRSAAILSDLSSKETPPVEKDKPPVDTPPVVVPPVDKDKPPVDTPPVVVPPVDKDKPPVEPGVAKPADTVVVKEPGTPPLNEITDEAIFSKLGETLGRKIESYDDLKPVNDGSPAEVTDEIIFSKLGETLGRKIESYDDLKPEELSPQLAELKKWSEDTGLPLSKWSDYNRDFSKMSDLDVAREILSKKFPNFTNEELSYSLSDYIYNEDVDEDGDKIKKSIALKKVAQEGRDTLEANKLKLSEAPAPKSLTPEQTENLSFAEKMRNKFTTDQKNQDIYNQKIGEAAQALSPIDLQLAEDLTIKFNVPDEIKKTLPTTVAEMPHWYNKDGSYNHANVVQDVAKVTNFDAIVKAVYEQGINVGKEGMIKKSANITIDQTQAPASTQPKIGNVQDIVDTITGNKQKTKLRFKGKK